MAGGREAMRPAISGGAAALTYDAVLERKVESEMVALPVNT